ncbi:MAG: hypothetical protein ACRD4B_01345, partial [Acidobacteriota bacterium]
PNAKLTDEDIRKIEDLYNKHQFVNIEERNGTTVDGVSARHFILRFDHERMVAFAKGLKDANIKAIPIKDEDIRNLEGQKQDTEDVRAEVWIANGDTFKQIQMYDVNKTEETITITFRDAEAGDVNVEAPKDAEDITKLLQQLFTVGAETEGSASPAAAIPDSVLLQ